VHQPRRLKDKIKTLDELTPIVQQAKSRSCSIVFTNGCFDILHSGHAKLLEQCRQAGDVLVVGLNSDASVRKLKGQERPIVAQEQRAEVVAALEAVDYVVIFDEPDPLQVITRLVPDVLIKGGDWTPETIIGRDIVEAGGGRVFAIPLMDGMSTTGIVKKMRDL
jgi:D-beta-D-heptose 7-phosphate kinase/D-beta-D-heptose 1-phosphate adenosyltransferase